MVIIDGKNVRVSQGDTLNLSFTVEGTDIENMTATFSVKSRSKASPTLKEEMDVQGNRLTVCIPATKMATVPAGVYTYDVVVENEETRTTLNFPALFTVVEVAHDF